MERSARTFEEALRKMHPVAAPADQREGIAEILRYFSRLPSGEDAGDSYKIVAPGGDELVVPESVFVLLKRILELLTHGDAVTVVPVEKELTTQQAANILNVSRQYVVQLLNEGRIPHSKVGTHRRIRIDDLLTFKRQRDRDQMEALDELTRLSQEIGGYDEIPVER